MMNNTYNTATLLLDNKYPSHWTLIRARNLFRESKEIVGTRTNFPLLSLTKGGVIFRDTENGKGKFPKDFESYKVVTPGQIIFCLFDIDETPRTVGLSSIGGMITGAYDVFNINEAIADPQFLYYYYLAVDDNKALKPYYSGLRKVVQMPKFLGIQIPIPPLNEQKQIVDFLTRKTVLIESQQREREREIQLLDELKQAEIANVVLRGLNPDAPTKEAQTIQFGRIPAHWEERKIQYCFSERSQKGFPNEPMLCATQSQGVIPQSMYANRVVVVNKDFDKQKLVKVGDFVISLRSFEGGIEYAYYQGIISAAYTILTPKEVENSEYFKHLFKSFNFIQLLQTCVTGIRDGQNINYPFLSKHFIPIPPIEEQVAIVEYIRKKNSAIDDMIANLRTEIDTLTEYKQRLIADVVTGQVDVRNL